MQKHPPLAAKHQVSYLLPDTVGQWPLNESIGFLKPNIELVSPNAIFTLGKWPTKAVLKLYDKWDYWYSKIKNRARSFESLVESTPDGILLDKDIRLFPVYHPGYFGSQLNRGDKQKKDWSREITVKV